MARFSRIALFAFLSAPVAALACGGSSDDTTTAGAAGSASGAGGSSAGTAGSGTSGSGTAGSGTAGTGTSGSATAGSGTSGSGTAGSATAGSGTSGSATAGSGTSGSGTAGSATAGSGTAGSGTSGSGTAGGSNAKCDSPAGCSASEYCNWSDELCGKSPYVGHCKARPSGCSDLYAPVCGCDGKVHSNECDAYSAGVDLAGDGGCKPPSDTLFACGARFCQLATEYCQKVLSDVGSLPDSYACMPIPPVCGNSPDCTCLEKTPCGGFACDGDAKSGMTTTCPGG